MLYRSDYRNGTREIFGTLGTFGTFGTFEAFEKKRNAERA